jgi:hypothetical protein
MSDRPIPEYRVLLTVDVEDYSSRTDGEQRTLQSALGATIDAAADAAELNRQEWLRQLGGDGVFAILPPGTDVTRLMDVFVRETDAALGAYNRRRAGETWSQMRLRMAVHAGPVHVDGATGWPGQHVVQPARLRDSDPVRVALRALPAADLAVIVSSEIYRDYITQGPGVPRPNEFRAVRVEVKKQAYVGYLYVPRFDVHRLDELTPYNVDDDEDADPGRSPEDAKPPAPGSGPRPEGVAGRDVIGSISNVVHDQGRIYQSGRDMRIGPEH